MGGGWEEGVEADSEGVLEHDWDDPFEDGAVDLETGVVVDLDEPGLEVSVDHEV